MGKQKLHHLTGRQLLVLVEKEKKIKERYWKMTFHQGLKKWQAKIMFFLLCSHFLMHEDYGPLDTLMLVL